MIRKIKFFYQSDRNFTKREVFENQIQVIINLSAAAEDRTKEFYPFIEYYKVPIPDCKPIKKEVIEAIFWLTKCKKALIHCYEGLNRSVAVIYHLLKMYNYDVSIKNLKRLNENFLRCTELLELE